MDRIGIIVAESTASDLARLRAYLERQPDMKLLAATGSGREAMALVDKWRPELVITELVLSEADGYGLLEHLRIAAPQTKAIVLSGLTREDAIAHAVELGASYYLPKPCSLSLLCRRIRTLCRPAQASIQPQQIESSPAVNAEENMEHYVSHMLMKLAVPPHLAGHRYLKEAVLLSAKDPILYSRVMSELYPTVARLCGTTPGRVERAIRFAIARSWDAGSGVAFNRLLEHPVLLSERPSNREFIASLAEHVRLQRQ